MKRVLVLIFVVGALASYAFAPHTSVLAFQDVTYTDCGPAPGPIPEKELTGKDVTAMCKAFHPNAVGTAYCLGGDCFKEHDGQHVSVAAENSGEKFPKIWFAWVKKGELTDSYPGDKCVLPPEGKRSGKGVRIEIPATKRRCKTELVLGNQLFHEHFASNPDPSRRCLVWMECRENLIAKKAP